jgi:hypothetical protein
VEGGDKNNKVVVCACENKTRTLRPWRESIKMPLFEYKFYRKIQEGGTRKTKWSCAKQNTDAEIVEYDVLVRELA